MRMRLIVALAALIAVSLPAAAIAQTETPVPAAARQSGEVVESASSAQGVAMRSLDDAPAAPAAKGRNNRILSENESYNLGRAAEGRVGLRLGNDMSFRIEKRAGTP